MGRIFMIHVTNIHTRKHQPTQIMMRVLEEAVIMMNKSFWAKMDPPGGARFPPKSLQDDCSSTILLESVQDLHHIPHLALYAVVLFFIPYIFLNKPMLRNIQKCITAEAHRATGNNSWTVTLDELNKFVGLIVARGVIDGRTLPVKIMWDKSWVALCSMLLCHVG